TPDDFAVARYNPDGTLDTSFSGDGKLVTDFGGDDVARAVAIQDDGKIVVAGYSVPGPYQEAVALARYNADGTPDLAFGTGGKVVFGADLFLQADAISIQDSKILVAGNHFDDTFFLARFNLDGTLDTSFNSVGYTLTFFGGPVGGTVGASAIAVQTDGDIVLAGHADGDLALARYHPNGTLDDTFGTDGRVMTDVATNTHFFLTTSDDAAR